MRWEKVQIFQYTFSQIEGPFSLHRFGMIKALMVWMGLEPGMAEWKAQTNPLSYYRMDWQLF